MVTAGGVDVIVNGQRNGLGQAGDIAGKDNGGAELAETAGEHQ